MKNTISLEYIQQYILAGRATVGFHSTKTNNTYWYIVKKSDKQENRWNVYMDFTVTEQARFLGFIKKVQGTNNTILFYLPGTDVTQFWSVNKKKVADVFAVTWDIIQRKAEKVHLVFLHKGNCGYCNRPLSDAESLITGIGPVCRKKLGI